MRRREENERRTDVRARCLHVSTHEMIPRRMIRHTEAIAYSHIITYYLNDCVNNLLI